MNLRRAFLLLVVLMTSCASVSHTPARKLVGRWRAATADRTAEYAFRADGTFSGKVASSGATLANFTGTWSVKGGAILYQYLTDTTGNIPPGTRDHDALVRVARSYFIIRAADGSERKYARIGD